MGSDAVRVNDAGGAESFRVSGKGRIKVSNAIKRTNYLYKTLDVRFSR